MHVCSRMSSYYNIIIEFLESFYYLFHIKRFLENRRGNSKLRNAPTYATDLV